LGHIFDALALGGSGSVISSTDEHEELYNDAVKHLSVGKEDVVLDAGCGTGAVTFEIAKLCHHIVGFDISRESIRIARQRAKQEGKLNIEFHLGELECPDAIEGLKNYEVYDKILVFRSLHHLPQLYKENSMVKLYSMLKPGGRIVIGDLMAFEPPEQHRSSWLEIGYDGGLTDRIESVDFHIKFLNFIGCDVKIERIHALLGIVVGYKKDREHGLFKN